MSLRYYQQDAINSVFQYFENGNTGNPLIAMPTGTGKSHVIGGLIKQAMDIWPRQRFIMATHVKELVSQNTSKLIAQWPIAPVGIHSAGLNQKDTAHPIIFGSIASMINGVALFGHRDILIIDEAHLVSPNENTMYRKFITQLLAINPKLKVLGLTATPYRLGQGLLIKDGLFTDTCFDITGIEAFNKLIDEGYLCPIISKPTMTVLDVSKVGIAQGDFKQDALQKAVDIQSITYAALTEACEAGYDRKSWLCFASGIDHAVHIADMLNSFGIPSAAVHSKMPEHERDSLIDSYQKNEFRCLVNYKMLTTGFDKPDIDMIIDLYPTTSPGLHVQKYGRGTRPSVETNKRNCLIMDFGTNTARLGPINDPKIPKKKGAGSGDAPIRICDACGVYNHASARFCGRKPYPTDEGCGAEFSIRVKITESAANVEMIRDIIPVVEYFNVSKVEYLRHVSKTGNTMLRVVYHCGPVQNFSEYVNFESPVGLVKHNAHEWFRQRFPVQPNDSFPDQTEQILNMCSRLRSPKRIRVHVNKQYPKILNAEF